MISSLSRFPGGAATLEAPHMIWDPEPGTGAPVFVWLQTPPNAAAAGAASERLGADVAVLSPEERARAERFRFREDFLAYVTAHALIRRALTSRGDRAPDEWRFVSGPHGRPSIHPAMNPGDLRFSLSHTRRLVACAVTAGWDCGVDVEAVGRATDALQLAAHQFCPDEVEALAQSDGAERELRFCALWCLKEAFLKAEGTGLSRPLNSISFRLERCDEGPVAHEIRKGPRGPGHCFRLFRPSPTHLGAVAVRRADPSPDAPR